MYHREGTLPVTVSTSDMACETNEPKGPMQQEARSAFLMSRKELPLSIVDVESQDSLDWGRGSDNGRMVEDIYCSITSHTLLTHFFQYIADILYDISKIMIVCDIISDISLTFIERLE